MNIELISILLIFVFSLFLILRDFYFSFYLLLFLSLLLHKELFSFYRWDLLPIRAFMLALVCAAIAHVYFAIAKCGIRALFFEVKFYAGQPFLILLFILWFIRGISIINSKNLQASLLLFSFFTASVVLCFFVYRYFFQDAERIKRYLKFYTFMAFGLSVFGYVQLFLYEKFQIIIGALWNIPGNIARVGATFWDVNYYGALLASLIPLVGVLLLTEKGSRKKVLSALVFLSLTISLLLTGSRSAWIMAAVTLLTFVSLMLVKKIGSKGIGYLVLGLFLLALPIVREYSIKSSPFRSRIKQYFHYRLDSFDSHFMLLTGAWEVFEKYPILGGGYGSFFEHFSKTKIASSYFGRDPAALTTRVPAHTIWGELLAETGVLGISVFILMFAYAVSYLVYGCLIIKEPKTYLTLGVMASVTVGWLVAGVFYSYNAEFFWIILSLFFVYGFSAAGAGCTFDQILSFFTKNSKLYLSVILALGVVLIAFGAGSTHLIPWDEAIYAKVAKNMVVSRNNLVEYWNPKIVWYEKPPLYMWAMAFFMRFMGFSSLAARLPSVLFGVATLFVVYFIGRKLFNKTTGFIAALILTTTVHFLYYSRASMLDVSTTFFSTSALFMYWLLLENNGRKKAFYAILAGVLIGFAVMTKGAVGLLPLLVIYTHQALSLVKQSFKRAVIDWKKELKPVLVLTAASLAVFLPWHLYMYYKFGVEFVRGYLGYHVWDRAVTAIEDKGNPVWWYVIVMKVSMRIWFAALLGGIPYFLYKFIKRDRRYIFLVLWVLLIFSFFSVAKSKTVWYILPIYPPLSVMVGSLVERLLDFIMRKIRVLDSRTFKFLALFVLTVSSLTYLFYIRKMVYTGDLTGSQARLLQLKDSTFGKSRLLYVDRVELPLVLYYTDGPFEVIDFNPKKEQLPKMTYEQKLILLTKKGRYSNDVVGITKKPIIVKEDGDWVLWFFESDLEIDKGAVYKLSQDIAEAANQLLVLTKDSSEYLEVLENMAGMESRLDVINSRINSVVSDNK